MWNGNEVWLLAAGGSMVAAFPRLYATSFSGFYLALMLVLWLLLLRGIAIEFRHQLDSELWREAWDVGLLGGEHAARRAVRRRGGQRAAGRAARRRRQFRGSFALLLNPFAVLCGVLSLAVLALHGAGFIAAQDRGPVQARARRLAGCCGGSPPPCSRRWSPRASPCGPTSPRTSGAGPGSTCCRSRRSRAWRGCSSRSSRRQDLRAFLGSASLIAFVLGCVASGLFPMLLPARPGSPHAGLDAYNSASPEGSLRIALAVYLFGMALVITYAVNVYRVWRGKVTGAVYH